MVIKVMRKENLTSEAYIREDLRQRIVNILETAQVQYSEMICWKVQEVQQKKTVEKRPGHLLDVVGVTPEKAMAPHSSTLAWKIPWTEEPGRLLSMGSQRVGHD